MAETATAAAEVAGRIGGSGYYEAVAQFSALGIGQSACVGIGAGPVQGMSYVDCLELFMGDEQTHGALLVGEIGGTAEEDVADYPERLEADKPVAAYVAGWSAADLAVAESHARIGETMAAALA